MTNISESCLVTPGGGRPSEPTWVFGLGQGRRDKKKEKENPRSSQVCKQQSLKVCQKDFGLAGVKEGRREKTLFLKVLNASLTRRLLGVTVCLLLCLCDCV